MNAKPTDLYRQESNSDPRVDFLRYESLFEKNGMPREDGFLQWRYVDNPARNLSTINFAVEKESGVSGAVYATMGGVFRVRGDLVGGVQSLDTLTDAAHRRKGLFPFLAQANYTAASAKGSEFVYGFPNANSCPTFHKHLGWTIFGPVDILVRPLRTGYFITRAAKRIGLGGLGSFCNFRLPVGRLQRGEQFQPVHKFDDRHSAIWDSMAQDVNIAVERSAEYLNWRIFARPDGSKYAIRDYSENGDKIGTVIWCIEDKHGGKVGYLMECLCYSERPDVRRKLLQLANVEMSRAGADLILAWVPSHVSGASAFREVGYYPLPTSLRPNQLYWGMRGFQKRSEICKSDWYISYLDSDTI